MDAETKQEKEPKCSENHSTFWRDVRSRVITSTTESEGQSRCTSKKLHNDTSAAKCIEQMPFIHAISQQGNSVDCSMSLVITWTTSQSALSKGAHVWRDLKDCVITKPAYASACKNESGEMLGDNKNGTSPHFRIPSTTSFCTSRICRFPAKPPFVPNGSSCRSRHLLYQMEAAAGKDFQDENSEWNQLQAVNKATRTTSYRMTMPTMRRISEYFMNPLHDLSQEAKQPIYFSPFEFVFLNANYSQKGLLFAKPTPIENQDFFVSTFLDDLRVSLSATLDHFYPLAARLATRKQENPPSYVIYIDPGNCQGVKFVHATVDAAVTDIVTSKDVTELTDGIFIGGLVNHLLADRMSFWHFMATWSEIFRSKAQDVTISRPPILKKWVLEGSDPIINLPYTHEEQFIERSEHPQVRERFFHFSSALVKKLKARANAECNTNKISSLQAVSAFIWKCVTRVRRQPNKSETVCRLVVSIRSRVNPPMT